MADYSYLQHVMEENDKLRKELDSVRVAYKQAVSHVEELLPWARIGAQSTDRTWEEAQALLRRIIRGEFDEVKS